MQATPNVPGPPIITIATGGNNGSGGTVALTWTEPADTGDSAILYYHILLTGPGIEGTYTTVPGFAALVLAYTVTDLDVSATYWFKVAAFNGVGPGIQSDAMSDTTT